MASDGAQKSEGEKRREDEEKRRIEAVAVAAAIDTVEAYKRGEWGRSQEDRQREWEEAAAAGRQKKEKPTEASGAQSPVLGKKRPAESLTEDAEVDAPADAGVKKAKKGKKGDEGEGEDKAGKTTGEEVEMAVPLPSQSSGASQAPPARATAGSRRRGYLPAAFPIPPNWPIRRILEWANADAARQLELYNRWASRYTHLISPVLGRRACPCLDAGSHCGATSCDMQLAG